MYFTVEDTFQFLSKISNGNLVEFGVFNGNTMNRLIKGAEVAGQPFEKVYGFDSFVGLPKETEGVWHNPEWPEGAFNLCDFYKLPTIQDGMQFARDRVDRKDINLIPGFFSDSLTEEIGKGLENSCSYLHIDVDIHASTVQVLDFIFTYSILKYGALVRYDDWISTPEYQGGNSLAHQQIENKYKVNWNRISTNVFQFIGHQYV